MSYSISFTLSAKVDLELAFEWYEEQKIGLGNTFLKEVNNALDSIQSSPLKSQIRYDDTRILFLKKFPYGIHFDVNITDIYIIAVLHTSRNTLR